MNIPMQPTPVRYELVQNPDKNAFEKEVNRLLEQGYTFHGPTTIDGSNYVQPMVQIEVRPVKMGNMDSAILPIEGILKR